MASNAEPPAVILRRLRVVLTLFIAGLVVSGVTAFPLLSELNFLVHGLSLETRALDGGFLSGAAEGIVRVRDALRATYDSYPFIAYGTDWLAFGHLIIALFFVGPLLDPVRNVFILHAGLLACVLVLPLALFCGLMREVPFGWRLVDCSFGVFGFPFLWYCLRLTRRLAAAQGRPQPS